MSGRSWSEGKYRSHHVFSENYLKHWDRSPVVIEDTGEYSPSYSSIKDTGEYNPRYPPMQVSQPIKYDLNNLNTDFFTTTTSPWDTLMINTDPLPDSFVENILSSFQKKTDKQVVEEEKIVKKEEIMDKHKDTYSIDKEVEYQNIVDGNKIEESHKPLINSYVGQYLM